MSKTLTPFGIVILILAALVGGVAVGGLLFLSTSVVYLICASPLFAAVLAGIILMSAIHYGKIRSTWAVMIAGVVMGLMAYGTYRYAEYLDFRRVSREDLLDIESTLTREETDEIISTYLQDETGSDGFIGFVKLEAEEGLSISSTRSYGEDTTPTNVGSSLTWGYWLLELAIFVIGTPTWAKNKLGKPYCEDENNWLKYEKIGYVGRENIDNFINLLKVGDVAKAGQLIQQKHGHLEVHVGRCSPHAPEAKLSVRLLAGRNTKWIIEHANLNATQYAQLVANQVKTS